MWNLSIFGKIPSWKLDPSSKEFLENDELFVWGGDDDANDRDFFWGDVIFWVSSSMLELAVFMSSFVVFFMHDISILASWKSKV